jgi:hypothetical protein
MPQIEIKGRKPAPNGCYWGNIVLNDHYKLVMIEPVTEKAYRAWTNKACLVGHLPEWKEHEQREGWFYCDKPKEQFNIFDW